jgi:Ca-activated chloride channel homolog
LRKLFTVLCISLLFLTVACSKDAAKKEDDTPKAEEKEKNETEKQKNEKENEVDIATVKVKPNSLQDLKEQSGGSLLGDFSLEKELETETETVIATIHKALHDELVTLTKKTEVPNEIAKEIIRLLGSPNYKETIEIAESFQPLFKEPYLPTPKKVTKGGASEGEIGKAIILLDASSSMLLSVNGEVKMDIAKDAVNRFADVIGQDNDVSLVVYGHKGSESNADKKLSCEGIEEVYPMGEYQGDSFNKSLSSIESKGWTPLAGAINKATEMSSKLDGPITVYIVSDGVETCDGNPVKAAEKFVQKNEDRTINIIGFNVDKKAEEQLTAVSEAGNGNYYSANNAEEIQKTIEYEWLPSKIDLAWAFTKAPGPWEILAEYDRYEKEYFKIRNLIKKENNRFDEAIDILSKEELIPSEVITTLREIISDRRSTSHEINNQFKSQKYEEIDQIAEEIDDRVDKWVEEMEEIVYE